MPTSALKSLGMRADVGIGPYRLRYTKLTDKSEFKTPSLEQCTQAGGFCYLIVPSGLNKGRGSK